MQFIKNIKIRTKIIIVCISILIVNNAISGIMYYNYAAKDILINFQNSAEDITRQANSHFTNEVNLVLQRVNAMCNNNDFVVRISKYLNNPTSVLYPQTMGYMANTLTEVYQGDEYIHSIYMQTRFGEFETFSKSIDQTFNFYKSELYQPFSKDENLNIAWFSARSSNIFLDKETVIPLIIRFNVYNCKEDIYLIVNFSKKAFENYLDDNYNLFDEMYILDSQGEEIAATHREPIGRSGEDITNFANSKMEKSENIEYDGKQYFATFSKIPANGWVICALKSHKSLLKNISLLTEFILMVSIISGILSLIIIVLMAYSITNPLSKLVKTMETVKNGDFHVRCHYKSKNEVGNLVENFNLMLSEINGLIEKLNVHIDALQCEKERVKEIQEQKRSAELTALQAQINPHFLYNTLNTITWAATSAGMKEISTISNALGKFFRISLSGGKEIISLSEELEHVENYLKIQKIRYKTKLSYEIDVARELLSLPVIKLIIQPLVENALYHGLKSKKQSGTIRISAKKSTNLLGLDMLVLIVEDNGIGISTDVLEQMNEGLMLGNLQANSGYGIYNVNERIRLYFGDEYGLSLDSSLGNWTKSILVIPII